MIPEPVERLLEKAKRSIAASEELLDSGFPDFSASRAYYAMFYTAEALLLAEGHSFSRHAAVIAAFGRYFAKPGRLPVSFHQELVRAFDRRNIADYDIETAIPREQAESAIETAMRFLEAAREFLKGSTGVSKP